MPQISIDGKLYLAEHGELLSNVLIRAGFDIDHPCGGMGNCGKCIVIINGKKELSCRYRIYCDCEVELLETGNIKSVSGDEISNLTSDNMCFALDIGTTTLALAKVNLVYGSIVSEKTSTNPQRRFGADIISRIGYCTKHGTDEPQKMIISVVNNMLEDVGSEGCKTLYVSGNATMLHIFFGKNPASMGVYPYIPDFIDMKEVNASDIGINGVEKVVSLPSVGAFVGADIVAGMNYIKMPQDGKHSILIDLGTNAEIVLFSDESSLCTAAAAGPCFEGANISSGMSALPGAVYAYSDSGYKTVGDTVPIGICGTGLIDIVSYMLEKGIVDKTGYVEDGEFVVCGDVTLTQNDIRQYQLAKSAIYSAVITIMKRKNVTFSDIEKVYISGGFSAEININNAVFTGLLPKEFEDKCVSVKNSSLLGTVKYAYEKNDLSAYVKNSVYVDLSADKEFSDLFVDNMMFKKTHSK